MRGIEVLAITYFDHHRMKFKVCSCLEACSVSTTDRPQAHRIHCCPEASVDTVTLVRLSFTYTSRSNTIVVVIEGRVVSKVFAYTLSTIL